MSSGITKRPWRRSWRFADGSKLQLVDGPRARPYLRLESREGLFIDHLDMDNRSLRSIGEALIWAADRKRP